MGSYQDRLVILRSMYGKNVLCTNGLFHIIDSNHKEIYINRNTGELDKRGKYKTVAVLDKTIIAEVLNDIKIKYVLLNKVNLECMYKTTNKLIYVDNNLLYDTSGVIISHTGKELMRMSEIKGIKCINNRYYVINSEKMFDDRLIEYIKPSDKIHELTKNKQYNIIQSLENDNILEVLNMYGGKYTYDMSKHECFNLFTLENDGDTQLWTLN